MGQHTRRQRLKCKMSTPLTGMKERITIHNEPFVELYLSQSQGLSFDGDSSKSVPLT
jgi:hypothetical protein